MSLLLARRQALGVAAELHVMRLLSVSAYVVRSSGCDLQLVAPGDGEVLRLEVKGARRSKDGKWRFTLYKSGSTDYRLSDVVILLAVLDSGLPVYFVIPVSNIATNQICITSHPRRYAGKWSKYRLSTLTLSGVLRFV